MTLKVAQWNVAFGFPLGADMSDPSQCNVPAQVAHMVSQAPDILFIQEADSGRSRSGYTNQPQLFAQGLGFQYIRFANTAHPITGQAGQAIISRYPIYDLRTNNCGHVLEFTDQTISQSLPLFRRGAAVAAVLVDGEYITVASAHMSGTSDQTYNQFAEIVSLITTDKAIICGDFNENTSTDWYQRALDLGYTDDNDGLANDAGRIDFIMSKGMTQAETTIYTAPSTSDHEDYLAEYV